MRGAAQERSRGCGMERYKHNHEDISQWLAAIVEFCDDAIMSKSLDGIFMTWNKAAERIFGYTPEEVIGKPATILIPPDRQSEETFILERIRRGEHVANYETVRIRKDGSLIDISLTVSPVKNAAGIVIGASKIARDITQRKHHEERIMLLAREAEHRTKNVLANVQAMVRLSDADSKEELKLVIQRRLQALSKVHRTLVEAHWVGVNVRRLARDEIAVYCRKGTDERARISGPDIVLPPEMAQVMAIAFHELATNAAKYGALSVPEGHIELSWSRSPEGLRISWTETGGPPVSPPARDGFGTRAMQRLITGQLNGSMHFDWLVEGLACEILLPI